MTYLVFDVRPGEVTREIVALLGTSEEGFSPDEDGDYLRVVSKPVTFPKQFFLGKTFTCDVVQSSFNKSDRWEDILVYFKSGRRNPDGTLA